MYTDDVLEAHEKEVEKLKEYYLQNKETFLKIKKLENVWSKMAELEERASDPSRLFGNRGGTLSYEEREREKELIINCLALKLNYSRKLKNGNKSMDSHF